MNVRLDHSLVSELLERLPVTLELLIGSIAIALTVGVASSFVAARTESRFVMGLNRAVAISLGCLPFFWLALGLALLAGVRWGDSIFGWASTNHFSTRDHLTHLIIPACVVALAELPITLRALEDLQYTGVDWKTDLKTRVYLSLQELAWRLPEVMGACLITEMAFAWPGEGRLFLNAVNLFHQTALAVDIVLLIAILTLLARSIIGIAVRINPRRPETRNA